MKHSEPFLRNRLYEWTCNLSSRVVSRYEIGTEVPIPYKHIYLPGNPPQLEIWCFKQDIAIYDILYQRDVGYREAFVASESKQLVHIILEKDNAQHTHHVGLPYLIIETKKAKPDTHSLITYSEKVKMIKTIFTYCKAMLVIFGLDSARTYRHGIGFDDIVSIDLNSKTDLTKFGKMVEALLKESKRDQNRIQRSAFA